MNFGKTFSQLCTPAMVYFVISVIAVLSALFSGMQFTAVAMQALFALFWTFILNFLCSKGFKSVSWFLVLLPYVLIIGGFLMTMGKVREGYGGARPPRSKEGRHGGDK